MADSILRQPGRKPRTLPVQPEQALSHQQALEGYTSHAALAAKTFDRSGTISTNKLGEFTVWAEDPRRVDAEELADIDSLLCRRTADRLGPGEPALGEGGESHPPFNIPASHLKVLE